MRRIAIALAVGFSVVTAAFGEETKEKKAATIGELEKQITDLKDKVASLENEVSRLAKDDTLRKQIEDLNGRFSRHGGWATESIRKLFAIIPVVVRPTNAVGVPNWVNAIVAKRCGDIGRVPTGLQTRPLPQGRFQIVEFVCIAPEPS